MSAGLVIGLIFIALCIIVQLSGVLEDNTSQSNKTVAEAEPQMSLDEIKKKIIEVNDDIEELRAKMIPSANDQFPSTKEIAEQPNVHIVDMSDITAKMLIESSMQKYNFCKTEAQILVAGILSPRSYDSNSAYSITIENHLKQMLESAEIILTTKNVDIFLSRFEFMKKLSATLIIERDNTTYIHHLGCAIEKYRNLYYDRIISDEQLSFAVNPIQTLNEDTFGRNLYLCFERYCDKMASEISVLKTQKAKDRRIEKIVEASKLMTPFITSEVLVGYANQVLELISKRFGVEFAVTTKREL